MCEKAARSQTGDDGVNAITLHIILWKSEFSGNKNKWAQCLLGLYWYENSFPKQYEVKLSHRKKCFLYLESMIVNWWMRSYKVLQFSVVWKKNMCSTSPLCVPFFALSFTNSVIKSIFSHWCNFIASDGIPSCMKSSIKFKCIYTLWKETILVFLQPKMYFLT